MRQPINSFQVASDFANFTLTRVVFIMGTRGAEGAIVPLQGASAGPVYREDEYRLVLRTILSKRHVPTVKKILGMGKVALCEDALEELPACMSRKAQNPGEESVSTVAGATVQRIYT